MATLTFATTTQFDFGAIQHLAGTLQQMDTSSLYEQVVE